jgi:hypothetical protein
MDLPAVLNRFAFDDPSGQMGRIAFEAGNLYRQTTDLTQYNCAAVVRGLLNPLEKLRTTSWLRGIPAPIAFDPARLHETLTALDALESALADAHPADSEVIPDYRWAMRLWRHSVNRLLLIHDPATTITPRVLADDMRAIMSEYRTRWLARSRLGGLSDSLVRMERLLAEYEAL